MRLLKSWLAAAMLALGVAVHGGCTPAVGNHEAQPGVTTPSELDVDLPAEDFNNTSTGHHDNNSHYGEPASG